MKEIILSVIATLLTISLVLNFFLMRGYDFTPPATYDEQLAVAKQIIAESVIAPNETKVKK